MRKMRGFFQEERILEGERKDKKKSARCLGRCCYFLWYMMFCILFQRVLFQNVYGYVSNTPAVCFGNAVHTYI